MNENRLTKRELRHLLRLISKVSVPRDATRREIIAWLRIVTVTHRIDLSAQI